MQRRGGLVIVGERKHKLWDFCYNFIACSNGLQLEGGQSVPENPRIPLEKIHRAYLDLAKEIFHHPRFYSLLLCR